jgi:multidrug efflux pump subunit AcrA (membrane-fusion protein)
MILSHLSTSQLQHVEAGQFIVRLLNDINSLGLDLTEDKELAEFIAQLNEQSEIYKRALQQLLAQKETEELAVLDLQRDRKISVLNRQIAVFEYSDNPEELKAYAAARIIMCKYRDIAVANYEAETLSIQNMLAEWNKPEHSGILSTLFLHRHLENLTDAANAFASKFDNRSAVATSKEVLDTFALKKQLLADYNEIASYIRIMANRKKNDFYTALLQAVNNGRTYFADILAKRAGNAAKEPDDASAA